MNQSEHDDTLKNFDEAVQIYRQKIVDHLLGMPNENLLMELREYDDDDLEWICQDFALQYEAYEICAAAQTVARERADKIQKLP